MPLRLAYSTPQSSIASARSRSRLTNMALAGAALGALLAGCNDNEPRDVTTRPSLVQYRSCDALERDLKEMLLAEVDTYADQAIRGGGPVVAEDAAGDPGAPSSDGGDRQQDQDYSGTNNQEAGVDEADFVKTDGAHVYLLNGHRLHIFDVPTFGTLSPASVVELEGSPRELLLHAATHRLVVFSDVWPDALPPQHPLRSAIARDDASQPSFRSENLGKVTVYDVAEATAPRLVRELYVEGTYLTARAIDSSIRVASYTTMNVPGLYDWWWYYQDSDYDADQTRARARAAVRAASLDDLLPHVYERSGNGALTTRRFDAAACSAFQRPANSSGRGFTSLLSLDAADDDSFSDQHVVSNWPTLYASSDYLYIAEPANDWWWYWENENELEQLNLHMFDITRPSETRYLGSGRVDGVLHNSFSLDEEDSYLRVATTVNWWNRWWLDTPPPSDNQLHVLELTGEGLETVGKLTGLARGEQIFSARMVGDRGYLVTFEQVDPLFTLDLSDPRNPRMVGELKIPGFSTYLHPIADDKLLAIGVGGDERGANWQTQVSMFDVSDFAAPVLADVEELDQSGQSSSSEALYEHKAFQYWAPRGLLAVPMSSYIYRGDEYQYSSSLALLNVDSQSGSLSRYGTIDHSRLYPPQADYWYNREIRRSIFMGDFIYVFSDRGITVHALDETLSEVDSETLPGTSYEDGPRGI